jgi:putative hydrolase of the HAD superfamily
MATITALFFDLGGVILSNGWDLPARTRAIEKFDLDAKEFQHRHEALVDDLETGKLSLDKYLKLAVFYKERSFTTEDFIDFIHSQSQPKPESLALLKQLRDANKWLLATLNNESRELNDYRIAAFGLKHYFTMFFNSGNVGLRKPEAAMYELALSVTQHDANECIFIDDREFNLELARERNFNTILFKNAEQLRTDLAGFGVEV